MGKMTRTQPRAVSELLDLCYTLFPRFKFASVKFCALYSYAVKEKLRLDPDSEIATTGVRVSLICPVSLCDIF